MSGRQEGDFGAGGDVAVCGWGYEHGESLRKIALKMVIAARFKRELITLTGRVGLLDGQEFGTMNGAASV